MNWPLVISGLLVGAVFGYVLQHGRFCMNTGFREVLFGDYTVFRAYILALVVLVVGSTVLDELGIIHFRSIPFTWLGNALGGYIFGIGMVLGGGCATGTLYRIGEGMIGSWFAALGFMLMTTAMYSGPLRPIADFLWFGTESFSFNYTLESGAPVTIANVLGINRWVVIALIVVPALIFVSKGKFKRAPNAKGFIWWTTGIMIGLIGVIGFYASEHYGGYTTARGLSFTGPLNELVTWFTGSSYVGTVRDLTAIPEVADAADFEGIDVGALTGIGKMTWSVWMIFGLVLGSLLSAMGHKEFSWRAPKANSLVTQLSGGLLMGVGGTLAGGCNVGHGLTGLATLALGSLIGIIFIVLGSWTMVYFLFIRE